MRPIIASVAVVLGLILIALSEKVSRHYKARAWQSEYFRTRFFGKRNLIPIGAALLILGLALFFLN